MVLDSKYKNVLDWADPDIAILALIIWRRVALVSELKTADDES